MYSRSPSPSPQQQTSSQASSPLPTGPDLSAYVKMVQKRSASEIIESPGTSFDQSTVFTPYQQEREQQIKFSTEATMRLFKLMMVIHAWGVPRSKHETDMAGKKFDEKLDNILETERQQEMTRQEMAEFIATMREKYEKMFGKIL